MKNIYKTFTLAALGTGLSAAAYIGHRHTAAKLGAEIGTLQETLRQTHDAALRTKNIPLRGLNYDDAYVFTTLQITYPPGTKTTNTGPQQVTLNEIRAMAEQTLSDVAQCYSLPLMGAEEAIRDKNFVFENDIFKGDPLPTKTKTAYVAFTPSSDFMADFGQALQTRLEESGLKDSPFAYDDIGISLKDTYARAPVEKLEAALHNGTNGRGVKGLCPE